MPYGSKIRGSIKARGKGKKGWPSKTRTYSWRTGSARPAEALKGATVGVRKAANVHRFTRWTPQVNIVNYDVGGGVHGITLITDDTVPTQPLALTAMTPDGTGSSAGSQSTFQYGGAVAFQLSDLPGVTDFTKLFDHYEIEQVDFEVNCLTNSYSGGALQTIAPTLTYVPDFDDDTLPSDASEISQYQRAKTWTFRSTSMPLKFSVKPRVAIPINAAGAAYAAGPAGVSINMANAAVPHYGLKFWVRGAQSGVGGSIQQGQHNLSWKMKYHLKFRDPK